ncbi:MAG: GMC family oxidoreductase [Ardenticatenaceae bacterium]
MYNYIIVGAGSAGCVLANRLSAEPSCRVLLLEAGQPDTNPNIHDPTAFFKLKNSAENWDYVTEPQEYALNQRHRWPRGKVLGGTSSLNGMIYIRGNRLDYDMWAYNGCFGWDYESVRPYFKKSEDFDQGANEYHGAGGELHVLSQYEPHPVHAALVEAAVQAGHPYNPDHNGKQQWGVGHCQLVIKDGRRQSTAQAFLHPVLNRPNLTAMTGALAHQLLFDGVRCNGVRYEKGGKLHDVYAENEVILCGGAMASPQLLMLSGIGDAEELRRVGIRAKVDLPGVGRNFQDHVLCPLIYTSPKPVPGVIEGLPPSCSHLFMKTDDACIVPDSQPLLFHIPNYRRGMSGPKHGFTMMASAVRAHSIGQFKLHSANPTQRPMLDPNYLSASIDVRTLMRSLEACREIANQSALDQWRDVELYPGKDVTGKELETYLRRYTTTNHHQSCTCKMGVDEMAVVDPQLRVYGVEGLRVADASIFPTCPTGNTNAPTIMVGEKAADMILSG